MHSSPKASPYVLRSFKTLRAMVMTIVRRSFAVSIEVLLRFHYLGLYHNKHVNQQ